MIKLAETNFSTRDIYSESRKDLYRIIESQKKELADIHSKFSMLTAENEKLRYIFDTALEQFSKMELRLKALESELEHEKHKNKELEKETKRLNSKLNKAMAKANKFASMLFGTKSEKITMSNIDIAANGIIDITCEEVESCDPESASSEQNETAKRKKRGARKGHSGHGRKKVPENLPVKVKIVDIDDKDKICSHCGLPKIELKGMERTSYKISKKVVYYVIEVIRKTYKTSCNCKTTAKIITAPVPDAVIPGSKFTEEVWTDFLISKYMLHLPIERQLFEMQQAGIDIKPGTVFSGLKKLYYDYFEVFHKVLIEEMQKASRLHADETRWHVFLDGHKKLWYMWGFRSENMVLFVLDSTRAADVPLKTLFNLTESEIKEMKSKDNTKLLEVPAEQMKKLNVDRYSSYKVLAKYGLVLLSFCWAHQRRDYTDLKKKYDKNPELCLWADEWLQRIANLYHINNQRVKFEKESEEFKKFDTELKSSLDDMEQIINSDKKYPYEEQTKIMNSMREHWNGLTLFVNFPELPMDNNLMENSMRPGALGRKNYIGNHSQWGGNLAACMYSIIQTCFINEINPGEYLLHYFRTMMKQKIPGQVLDKEAIRKILPFNIKNEVFEKIKLKKF